MERQINVFPPTLKRYGVGWTINWHICAFYAHFIEHRAYGLTNKTDLLKRYGGNDKVSRCYAKELKLIKDMCHRSALFQYRANDRRLICVNYCNPMFHPSLLLSLIFSSLFPTSVRSVTGTKHGKEKKENKIKQIHKQILDVSVCSPFTPCLPCFFFLLLIIS